MNNEQIKKEIADILYIKKKLDIRLKTLRFLLEYNEEPFEK